MSEPVNVIVARVRIVGSVDIQPEHTNVIKATPGARLLVKLPFRYDEVSSKKDDFRIRLTSDLGGDEAEPVELAHQDRRGVADDRRGFLLQEYVVPGPGEYTLSFRAAAEYVEDGARNHHAIEGTLPVQVESVAPPPL